LPNLAEDVTQTQDSCDFRPVNAQKSAPENRVRFIRNVIENSLVLCAWRLPAHPFETAWPEIDRSQMPLLLLLLAAYP
jgi:hypothetical protein